MKKALLILSLIISTITACKRHNTIFVSDNDHFLKIEYAGTIIFNDDNTGVLRISPGGYFKCKNNYDKLQIEPDSKGQLLYEMNGNNATRSLNYAAQSLMKQAVKEIEKQHHKDRS